MKFNTHWSGNPPSMMVFCWFFGSYVRLKYRNVKSYPSSKNHVSVEWHEANVGLIFWHASRCLCSTKERTWRSLCSISVGAWTITTKLMCVFCVLIQFFSVRGEQFLDQFFSVRLNKLLQSNVWGEEWIVTDPVNIFWRRLFAYKARKVSDEYCMCLTADDSMRSRLCICLEKDRATFIFQTSFLKKYSKLNYKEQLSEWRYC